VVGRDLSRLGCAIERHRLANGKILYDNYERNRYFNENDWVFRGTLQTASERQEFEVFGDKAGCEMNPIYIELRFLTGCQNGCKIRAVHRVRGASM